MDINKNWRFCAVGNIKAKHTCENGKVLYGSKAFSGGTKVYIDDKTLGVNSECVSVIGLNRFGRYTTESVSVNLIENVRAQRIYKPVVLREVLDGWRWRGRTAEDRKAVKAFAEMWSNT